MSAKRPTMNCRERVLRAIRFEKPDRIPFTYSVIPPMGWRYGQKLLDLLQKYPNDFYDPSIVKILPHDTEHYRPDGTYYKEWTDEWGSVWVYYREGISGEVKRPVLDDWSKLKTFKVPPLPASTPEMRRRAKDDMSRMKEQYVGWGGGGSLFEQMQWLRGPENLMIDIAMDADIGAQPAQFGNVHEAVFENGFADDRGAFGAGHQGHELGL